MKRTRQRRADEGHETHSLQQFATPHSITPSARTRSVGEIERPNALAVLRLITISNFIGRSTGRSAGRAPGSPFPSMVPVCRNVPNKFGPYDIRLPARAISENRVAVGM